MVVVGADAYLKGWAVVALRDGRCERVVACASFRAVLEACPDAVAVGVDIPIGLPVRGLRPCDAAVRRLLGARRSSVFATPTRTVLDAPTYAEALARCRELGEAGVSRQAYALRTRILDVDGEVRRGDGVFEVHPELSFRTMAGHPLATRKTTWAGMWERLALLRRHGIEVPHDVGAAGAIPPADIIDAAAAAWTASRIATGTASSVSTPAPDPRGRPLSIWY